MNIGLSDPPRKLRVRNICGSHPVDKAHLTQVGRALARLGIEHIPAYSPQARGRSERLNRTLQDRLVNELRVPGITTLAAANHYLAATFIPQHNATFARAPRDPASAFVPLGEVDLDAIFCHEEACVVSRDNTVTLAGRVLQIAPQPGRRSCAGLTVLVRHHLNGRFTVVRRSHRLALFARTASLWKLPVRWTPRTRPPHLGKRQQRVSHSSHSRPPGKSGQITCQTQADRSLVNNTCSANFSDAITQMTSQQGPYVTPSACPTPAANSSMLSLPIFRRSIGQAIRGLRRPRIEQSHIWRSLPRASGSAAE
jgi:hypothetical protein